LTELKVKTIIEFFIGIWINLVVGDGYFLADRGNRFGFLKNQNIAMNSEVQI
jgi:hypothetical protein